MWLSVGQGLLVSTLLGRQTVHGEGMDKPHLSPARSPPSPAVPGEGPAGLKPSLCPAGQRWSTACAYLHPALSRPNLTAEARAFVSRVLFEGTRAVGVEYVKNGQSHRVSPRPAWAARMGGREWTVVTLHRRREEGAAGGKGPVVPWSKCPREPPSATPTSELSPGALHTFPEVDRFYEPNCDHTPHFSTVLSST